MIVRFDHGRVITTGLDIGVQPKNQDQLELCIFLQDRVGLQSSQMHHQRDDVGFDNKVLVSQPVSQPGLSHRENWNAWVLAVCLQTHNGP